MVEKTTSSRASCSPRKTGLEVNKTKPDGPKIVDARPEVLKIPQNLVLLAEARSDQTALSDAVQVVEGLLSAIEQVGHDALSTCMISS